MYTVEEKLFDNYKVVVSYDEFCSSPREYEEYTKLCIREHRRYNFPNELNFDFDKYDEWDLTQLEEIEKDYDIFWIDCYEHSWIAFSLTWHWVQCQWDTAKYCGFIAIPKVLQWDKRKLAQKDLTEYNQYLNWEVYEYGIYRKHTYKDDNWEEIFEWDYIEWCWWYYDSDECLKDWVNDLKAYGLA